MEKVMIFDKLVQSIFQLEGSSIKQNAKHTIKLWKRNHNLRPTEEIIDFPYFFLVVRLSTVSSASCLSFNSSIFHALCFNNIALPKFRFSFSYRTFRFYMFNVMFLCFIYCFHAVCCQMWWSMLLFLLKYVAYASMLVCSFGLLASRVWLSSRVTAGLSLDFFNFTNLIAPLL